MILRGARVSAEIVRVAADARRGDERRSAAEPAMTPPAAPPFSDPRPALDASTVRIWIAQQDEVVRQEVALDLASEIAAEYAASRARGLKEGRDEAAAKLSAEREAHAATLDKLAAELRSVAERQAAALASSCAEIVLEVLKKIAGPALAQPTGVEAAVIQVLRRVKDAREVIVRVRPAELEMLERTRPALAEALGDAALTLIADQRVQLGGCIVESKLGNLDGRLEVQFGELCEALRLAKAEGVQP